MPLDPFRNSWGLKSQSIQVVDMMSLTRVLLLAICATWLVAAHCQETSNLESELLKAAQLLWVFDVMAASSGLVVSASLLASRSVLASLAFDAEVFLAEP